MKKAILDGILQHVSPSQIKTFSACQRKWWYEKVAGLRPEQTPAQREGDAVHKEAERYYQEGTPVTHPALLKAMKILPPRGEGVLSEHPRDYALGLRVEDVPLIGRIDLLQVPNVVWDFKTRKNLTSFLMKPEQLAVDEQLITYGKYCVEQLGAKDVTLQHLYLHKTKADYKPRAVNLCANEIRDNFERLITPSVAEMKVVATFSAVDSLPTVEYKRDNFGKSPCESYGGCPFKAKCFGPEKEKGMFDDFPEDKPAKLIFDEPLVKTATSLDFVLYIDCLPLKGISATPLEDSIATKAAIVCEKKGVKDVREIKFGEGTSALIALMKSENYVGAYTVSSTGLGGLVSEALIPMAKVVIRGVR